MNFWFFEHKCHVVACISVEVPENHWTFWAYWDCYVVNQGCIGMGRKRKSVQLCKFETRQNLPPVLNVLLLPGLCWAEPQSTESALYPGSWSLPDQHFRLIRVTLKVGNEKMERRHIAFFTSANCWHFVTAVIKREEKFSVHASLHAFIEGSSMPYIWLQSSVQGHCIMVFKLALCTSLR